MVKHSTGRLATKRQGELEDQKKRLVDTFYNEAIQSRDACLPDMGRGKEVLRSRQKTTS